MLTISDIFFLLEYRPKGDWKIMSNTVYIEIGKDKMAKVVFS